MYLLHSSLANPPTASYPRVSFHVYEALSLHNHRLRQAINDCLKTSIIAMLTSQKRNLSGWGIATGDAEYKLEDASCSREW